MRKMEKASAGSRRISTIAMLLGVMFMAGGVAGQEQEYKPIKAPMIPGVRKLADAVKLNLTKNSIEEAGGDILFASDLASESQSGASNYATALGNGRLSVEISPWGELVVFRWPNPSYSDQLRYFTVANNIFAPRQTPVRCNKDCAGPDWRRYGRPIEVCQGLGSRAGVQVSPTQVVWMGDPSWTSSRGFVPEDSTVLRTELARPEVKIAVDDWIDPDQDLMVRSYQISGQATRFFYHATFAPFMAKPGEYTKSDPANAGFAAIYSAPDQVMIHFQPKVKDQARLEEFSGSVIGVADLDAAYPEGGVFVAWGFNRDVSGYQVEQDGCDNQNSMCRFGAPVEDLKGKGLFIGKANSIMSHDLGSGQDNNITVLIAVSDSAVKAVDMIMAARTAGADTLRQKAVSHWQGVSANIHLPAAADPITARVARRSVLNLIQAQDQESGEIVASLSRQPHYHFDWTRDGAFFDLTLDLAGFPERVTRHNDFYTRTQFTKKLAYGPVFVFNFRSGFYDPSGHWPSNMSPDGHHGSMPSVMPFEIDETGLPVWDFWRHERVLPESERSAYIVKMKDTFERAADALTRFTDVKKGWVRPALEDDNFPPEATLHGASSVLAGLAGACDAGPRWGFPAEKTAKWCAAAWSLREGIRARSAFPETLDMAGFRGLAWTLWPAPAFDDYREPGARAIKERIARSIREKIDKQRPGFAYLGEEVFILALADKDHEYTDLLQKALTVATHEVAFPGADCYGEVTLWGDFAGTGQKAAQQRTSIPHLWNGVTVYLSALAVYQPELFDPMRPPAPR